MDYNEAGRQNWPGIEPVTGDQMTSGYSHAKRPYSDRQIRDLSMGSPRPERTLESIRSLGAICRTARVINKPNQARHLGPSAAQCSCNRCGAACVSSEVAEAHVNAKPRAAYLRIFPTFHNFMRDDFNCCTKLDTDF